MAPSKNCHPELAINTTSFNGELVTGMPFPYKATKDLPEAVRNALPDHAQEIFLKAANAAWEKYRDPKDRRDPKESRDEVAYKIAWAAVERGYEKDPVTKTWRKRP